MKMCIHEMPEGTCALCGQRRTPPRGHNFVWITSSRYYHEADCEEVLWDPAEAEHPAEREELTVEAVRALLDDGTLERGCLKCQANAHRERLSQ